MHIAWQTKLGYGNTVDFSGPFYVDNNLLYYPLETTDPDHKTGDYYWSKVIINSFDITTGQHAAQCISYPFNNPYEEGSRYRNVSKWEYVAEGGKLYLYTGNWVELQNGVPKLSQREDLLPEPVSMAKVECHFGNKIIRLRKMRGIECLDAKTGEVLWFHSLLKGYPYPPIEEKNGYVFLDTAGKGGAFYMLRLEDGEITLQLDNGGLNHHAWDGDNVLLKDKKGNLVRLNPWKDQPPETLVLKEKMFGISQILVHNKRLFTMVYDNKQNISYVVCVELEG